MKKIKMNIFRKTLILSLSTALLSFLAFGIISFFIMDGLFNKSISYGKSVGKDVAQDTEKFVVNQAKERLQSLASEKSKRIEHGMGIVKKDTESIAIQMNQILSHPEEYKSLTLPNIKEKVVYSGEAYIYYPLEVERIGISDELRKEAALSANIVDVLNLISKRFIGHQSTSYICSKNGFLILVETSKNSSDTVTFTQDYEPRKRIWYTQAEEAQKTIITDIYMSMQGYPAISCATPYYDGKGNFAGVAAVDANLESLYDVITHDSSGTTSINFTLNKNGEVILSSAKTGTLSVSRERKDLRQVEEASLANEIQKMSKGKVGLAPVKVDGKDYFLAYFPMPKIEWSFGSLIKIEDVIRPVKDAILIIKKLPTDIEASIKTIYYQHIQNILLTIVIVLVWLLWISIKDSRQFVTPIVELTNGVKEIAKGNLDKKLDIKTGDEIEVLSDSVNNMTSELKLYIENLSKIAAEKERISTELNVAKHIQAGMLPNVDSNFSNKKEFDLAASMNPAKEVGGDFYDFYMVDENHLAITVADVSGKGVGAALFMVISKTLLKDFTMMTSYEYSSGREPDFAEIIEWVNKQLRENNKENMFVTVFFGVLDLRSGEFVYVNAGHNPPLVRQKNTGEFSYILHNKKNCALGVSKKVKYQEHRLQLSPGDMLFFYTDGITEAMNEQRELFNENRLKSALDTVSDSVKADEILSTVNDAVKLHVGNAEQSDDMTMLGLVYRNS